MNGGSALQSDEIVIAAHAALSATCRKSLERQQANAYSASIDNEHPSTNHKRNEP